MAARSISQAPQKHGQCVHRQVACVDGGLRKAADSANQLFAADLPGVVYISAFDQLRDGRPTGHRWHASFGAKANVGDTLPIQFQREFQDVSASGVLQTRESVGSFNLARVSRVLKMIQEFGGIHRAIVMRRLRDFAFPARAPTIRMCATRTTLAESPACNRARPSFWPASANWTALWLVRSIVPTLYRKCELAIE